MRTRITLAWIASVAVGRFALALAGAADLAAVHTAAVQKKDPNAAIFSQLLNATGYVGMINSEPTRLEYRQNGPGVLFSPFTLAGCSATYFLKPAFFITSAKCFATKEGKLDRNRRLAQVFVAGKGYKIDPATIIIHEDFNKTQAEADLAIFSLDAGQIDEFARAHTPITLLSEDTWITEGQRSWFIGYGKLTETGNEYGLPRIKEFIHRYPDATDLQAANGKLNVGPQEHVLTYVTKDGSQGVNCKGDSGAGSFIEVNNGSGQPSELLLQGVILGKVGPDGNFAACESISKYAVVADLRYETVWIEKAIQQIHSNVQMAAELKSILYSRRDRLFGKGSNAFGTWASLPVEELSQYIDSLRGVTDYQNFVDISQFMQMEQSRLHARDWLAASSKQEVNRAERWQALANEDPWGGMDKGGVAWRFAPRLAGFTFQNPAPEQFVSFIRIRNLGDGPMTLSSSSTEHGSWGSESWNNNTVLRPGQALDITHRTLRLLRAKSVSLYFTTPANMTHEKRASWLSVRSYEAGDAYVRGAENAAYNAIWKADDVVLKPLQAKDKWLNEYKNTLLLNGTWNTEVLYYTINLNNRNANWNSDIAAHNNRWDLNYDPKRRRY